MRSIRMKLTTLYFLLVFIGMIIAGVFIIDQLERYHIGLVGDSTALTMQNIVSGTLLREYEKSPGSYTRARLEEKLSAIALPYGSGDLSVVNTHNFLILASTKPDYTGKDARGIYDDKVMLGALDKGFEQAVSASVKDKVRTSTLALLHRSQNPSPAPAPAYLIVARANLENVYGILKHSTAILMQATVLSLLVTVVLGFFISRSITGPINELKDSALEMAAGDFSKRVSIKSDDEIGQLGGAFNYLTEKVDRSMREIASEKDKLGVIVSNMTEGLAAIGSDGRILHLNPSFLALLGLSEDVTGQRYDPIIEKFSQDLTYQRLQESLRAFQKEPVVFENSRGRQIKAAAAPFKDDKNDTLGLIIVFQDITESQRMETLRKEFVANVSHELKTPITTIKSYTETLLMGAASDTKTCRSFLEVIDQETDRMTVLIQDLLFLSRMDHRFTEWNFTDIDVCQTARQAASKLTVYLQEKEQKLCLDLPNTPRYIRGDANLLEQVFINLLSNAIKYTPPTKSIRINLHDHPGFVSVHFTDAGIGIAPEHQKRVFERFYRVDKSRSREQGGTGLGLSICKNIIEEHQGFIRLQSEVGIGSEFIVFLPISPA